MARKTTGCLIVLLGVAAFSVWAQTAPPQPPPVTVEEVAAGIYLVRGGAGANCGFLVGDNDVLIVDSKMTVEASRSMLAEIGKITAKPVRTLVLTHSDGDHVNGIAGFPANVAVISQLQTKLRMAAAFSDREMQRFLPQVTFAGEALLARGNQTVRLLHFGPAHTDGDLVVFVPAQKTAFVGDLLFIGRDPLIHLQKNGSSAGLIQVWRELLKLDVDLFLPGHGNPARRGEVEVFIKGLEEKRARIVALVNAGKSLEEIKKEFGIADPASPPGQRRWPSFVEIVCQELSAQK